MSVECRKCNREAASGPDLMCDFCRDESSLGPAQCSASGVEAETWSTWLKKHHAALNLDKPEDYGMFLAFALVETRLRSIGQYTGDSPKPNGELKRGA